MTIVLRFIYFSQMKFPITDNNWKSDADRVIYYVKISGDFFKFAEVCEVKNLFVN
jgi:hypothetical protein